jgi:DegV family protein with EDD domain
VSRLVVITDWRSGVPLDGLNRLNIRWVAHQIDCDHDVLRDLASIQPGGFCRWLPSAKKAPTTASPGPGDDVGVYEPLADEPSMTEIVSIHMTSAGCGAQPAAVAALAMADERHPELKLDGIDTRTVSLAHGWMVFEAWRAAMRRERLEQVFAGVRTMIAATRMIHTADTLRSLYSVGRLRRAKPLVGCMLNSKTADGMENGVVVPLAVAL